MSLKAKLTSGNSYTNRDTIETQLTYSGDANIMLMSLEVISGPDVTHGGGALASESLHYKSVDRDAVDGVIDYRTCNLFVVQSAKGTSVIKIVASLLLQADVDDWQALDDAWSDAYETVYLDNQGNTAYVEIADGAPDRPIFPGPTIHKSGELTLEWADDSFV